jgi:hypothetical protein
MSGFKRLRRLLMVIPAEEKARSLDTEDDMTARLSRASDAQTG